MKNELIMRFKVRKKIVGQKQKLMKPKKIKTVKLTSQQKSIKTSNLVKKRKQAQIQKAISEK